VPALLRVLVLGEVLVAKAPSEVGHVPAVAPLDDLRLGGAAQRVLVEGVGDDLTNGFRNSPVVEDLLDVEVEQRLAVAYFAAQASISTRYSGTAGAAT
jgi:hypothetical protein